MKETKVETPNSSGLRKVMIINTISNYGKLLMGLFITIFLTRLLFMGLSREEYGIWALLWSIFGYSLLLDFGFGAAIQKTTSQTQVKGDWEHYNRVVSTVFVNYLLMGVIIAAATIGLSFFIGNIFNFTSQTDIIYYRKIFIMFGVGTAIVFPSGFFVEVLRGLHQIKLRNFIQMFFNLANFILMFVVIKSGLSLWGMTVVTIVIALLTNLTMAFFAFKKIPTLKISLKYYDFKLLKQVMSFSLFAYIITFTNLIIFRTDQMVISIFASVSLVAVYQISSRLALTFKQFSSQFMDNLAPVAARLFASDQENKLAKILIESNRLLGFIATLMFVPLVVFVKPLLYIWLELSDPEGIKVAILLLISMYILVSLRSSTVYILLMGNKHKKLSRVAIMECIGNLGLSIFLIHHLGIIGVALGTLIPNILVAALFHIPAGIKFSGLTFKEYFRQSIQKNLSIGAISLLFALALSHFYTPHNFFGLMGVLAITTIFYLALYYKFGTYGWEKKQFKEFLQAKLKK